MNTMPTMALRRTDWNDNIHHYRARGHGDTCQRERPWWRSRPAKTVKNHNDKQVKMAAVDIDESIKSGRSISVKLPNITLSPFSLFPSFSFPFSSFIL